MPDKPNDTTRAPFMSPETFCQWLDEMRAANLANSDAAAARLLGITPRGLLNLKTKGADRVTALACNALLVSLWPFER